MTSDRKTELDALLSTEVPRRLDAARYLEKYARAEDAPVLKSRAQAEPDELVARVLRRAVARAEGRRVDLPTEAKAATEELLTRERARAIRDATGMFLHEMRPLVGNLEVIAAGLIADYEGGPLRAGIERIRETLAAFEDLRSAAHGEHMVEFNLTALVASIVQEQSQASDLVEMSAGSRGAAAQQVYSEADAGVRPSRIQATLGRDDPVITLGSPKLLRLVLTNAVRNAIEACESVIEERAARVVVSWGATDVDAWISVVDDGPGLNPSLGSPWEVGATTKNVSEHRGLGLVIVDQAVDSMDGAVELVDGEAGGCRFEVRWPIAKEPG